MEINVLFENKQLKKFGGTYKISLEKVWSGVHARNVVVCIIQKDHQFWSGTAIRNPCDEYNFKKGAMIAFGRALNEMYKGFLFPNGKIGSFYAWLARKDNTKTFNKTFWRAFLETLNQD